MLATGTGRVRIEKWLPDAPYPRAEVEDWPDEPWSADTALLGDVGRQVRSALALAVELGEASGDVGFAVADDPTVAAWQLCAAAPLGLFDRQRLLTLSDPAERMARLKDLVADAQEAMTFRLRGGSADA